MAQTPCVLRQDSSERIDYTPGTAVAAGQVVLQGTLIGIATVAIAANEKGSLCTRGIFNVPKDSSNLSAVGTAIYWDADGNPVGGTAGSGCFTSTATGNTFAGWCLETAGASVGDVDALILSSFAVSVTTLDALTDVGTVAHATGTIIVADGSKYEEVALSGAFALAATGALTMAVATKAAAGSAQGDATAITAEGFCLVTAADDAKGVKLPAAAAGKVVIIKNSVANKDLLVYPNTDDKINGGSANAALTMADGTAAMFIAYDATDWYTVPLLPS
jgi:predicted RecA/RadA family phage recombinase